MYHKKARLIVRFAAVLFLLVSSILSRSSSSAQEFERPPLKIVQLGDSYSAGNGARSPSGEPNYYGPSDCYRSPNNWGSQFANSLKDTFAVTYINRACSGAVVANITEKRDMGDVLKENGNCPTPEYPDEEFYESISPFSCKRYLSAQFNAIDSSTDLIVMTIGGNDLGFGAIVTNCFTAFASPAGCRNTVNNANEDMERLRDNLIDLFGKIKTEKLRPGARIAYVVYPQLILDTGYRLIQNNNGVIVDSYDAGTEVRALGVTGEQYQRAAVDAANAAAGEDYIVFYDGTKALFAGHETDPSIFSRNPERWLHEFEGSTLAEWYHPNELGHENWGQALSVFETFGAAPGAFDTNADIDVAFVVDTTGSMGSEIAEVQANLSSLVDQLAAQTDSYRVAVVSYRDFPERTGDPVDYPFRVDQTFTDDPALIQAAIDSLTLGNGGDWEETVFSGIQAAIELSWRPGVTKIMIVIGDAPALSPEPISNLTASQIVANSIAVDPVQVIGVDVGYLNDNGALGQIADGTGGSVVQGTSGLTDTILEILESAANQPFAWIGQAYSGKIGQPVLFDASGSYDPSGSPITLYEWDFNGDGVFDISTQESATTHVYDAAFNDYVILRVTGEGGTALASARTVVNDEGFAPQGGDDACELDENGFSIITDENGIFINCTPDSLPEDYQDGVSAVFGSTPNLIFADSFESGDFSAWYWAETDGSDLSVSTEATAVGTYGAKAVINDSSELVLYDHSPDTEKHYSARFYFHPNSVQTDFAYLFAASSGASGWVMCLHLDKQGNYYSLALCGKDDNGAWFEGVPVLVADEWQAVEIEWKAAAAGTNDGYINLYIGGELADTVSNLDNDAHAITKISWGVDGPEGCCGTMYFDAFESRRGSYIGLDPNGPAVNPAPPRPDFMFADDFESGELSA
jgi:lysophospholipase L1-like esterase